jgi:hypothetical protein
VLSIDINSIDTNVYSWKYHYINSVPVAGGQGYILQGGDLNRNGKIEVYGYYQTQTQLPTTRIYELDEQGIWNFKYTYPLDIGVVEHFDDIDHNGLSEIYSHYGDSLYVFEQSAPNNFPVMPKFRYQKFYLSAIEGRSEFDDFDKDGVNEFLYRGSEPGLTNQRTTIQKTYIAKYDNVINNFRVVWGKQFPSGCTGFDCAYNMSIGDFDRDSLLEFVTSTFAGNVYMIEYVNDDSFQVVWFDSLSAAGWVTSGDVDENGTTEFFVGGKIIGNDGYFHLQIFAYEHYGNNIYQPFFMFDIFPVGSNFDDVYQTVDIDGDGQKELLLAFRNGIVIIKGNGEHNYKLFYYKYVPSLNGIAAIDVNTDGVKELFVSRFLSQQQILTQTDVYRLDSSLMSVGNFDNSSVTDFILYPTYPNPFNGSMTIKYTLQNRNDVRLTIFDVSGKQVVLLVDTSQEPGTYNVLWNGTNNSDTEYIASGIYFCRLTANNGKFSDVKKLMLLK